jgi:phosphoglycolate phosphatase
LNHPPLDAAIVDLDGTMVDTLGDFVAALNLMLADLPAPARGWAIDAEEVRRRVGKGSEHLVLSVLNHLAGQAEPAPVAINTIALYEPAFAAYQRHYKEVNGRHAVVYPGVVDGLRRLQDGGLKLACLTNKPLAFAQALLRSLALDGYFSVVYGGDSFAVKKPDPLPLLKTCEALGTAPARTLMLGDSSNDAEAARAAGCPVVLVTYGYNHGEPVQGVDADGFVDSINDLRYPA